MLTCDPFRVPRMETYPPLSQSTCHASYFDPPRSGVMGQSPIAAEAAYILDPLQTSSQPPVTLENHVYSLRGRNIDSIPFEHTGWHNVRMRIDDAMEQLAVPDARRHKFTTCGDDVYVYREGVTGEIDYNGSRCGDRFCLVCGQARSHRIARSLEPRLRESQPLFLTFTVRGLPGDRLATLINRLSDAWKELRRMKLWKDNMRGGAIMLEIKYSTTSGGHWHPHYHVVCDGDYVEKDRLKAAWKAITRDSDQVDIKRITDLQEVIGYVVKYASKPMDASFTMVPALLREAMETLRGKRLCACFGTWYGTPLNDQPEEEDAEIPPFTNWVYLGTKRDLECRAERGDREAIVVLGQLERQARLRHALSERCQSPPKVCHPAHPPNTLFTSAA